MKEVLSSTFDESYRKIVDLRFWTDGVKATRESKSGVKATSESKSGVKATRESKSGVKATRESKSVAALPAKTSDHLPYHRENGFEHKWRGGETAALEYLDSYFHDGEKLHAYRGATESFAHGETENPVMSGTRLSAWLAFGCISPREVLHRVKHCERNFGKKGGGKSVGKGGSTGSRLHTELNFRDFLRFAIYFRWKKRLFHLHGPFELDGADTVWRSDHKAFEKWRKGDTGFPFVDAGMRELRNYTCIVAQCFSVWFS